MSVATTERNLRRSIAEIISYGALYGKAYTDTEILQYLNVKASIVGMRSNINKMIKRRLISEDKSGRYKLKNFKYPNQNNKTKDWAQIVSSAKKHTKVLRYIPFIKAVVVLPQSDEKRIRIAVITLPARLHITRLLVEKFYAGRNFQDKDKKQIEIIDTLYFTTAGLRFLEEYGWSDLDRIICLLSTEPVHGKELWQSLLEKNNFVRSASPNYIWPRSQPRVYASSMRRLDSYDDKAYRAFLRSMANKPEYRHGGALLRIRPDVIIADPYSSKKKLLEQQYNNILKRFK